MDKTESWYKPVVNFISQAPFTVEIESSALVTMDTHCHLAKTEVIGMLGGQYLREQGTVVIRVAEPCESVSTGLQCEMDPGRWTKTQRSRSWYSQSMLLFHTWLSNTSYCALFLQYLRQKPVKRSAMGATG